MQIQYSTGVNIKNEIKMYHNSGIKTNAYKFVWINMVMFAMWNKHNTLMCTVQLTMKLYAKTTKAMKLNYIPT